MKMKKMRWAVVLAAAWISVIGLNSCLDNDNESSWDAADYVTVKESLGSPYLVTDNGVTLYPTSTSVLSSLLSSDGTYYPRAIVYYKYAEGEAYEEGKTSYNISAIAGGQILDTKDFNAKPDTLANDYPIKALGYSSWTNVWAKNGYINVPFTTMVGTNVSVNDFHMYITEVSGDTLCTRFHQSGGGEETSEMVGSLICFKLPFDDSRYADLVPDGQDSIVIKVVANGEKEVLTKTIKYRYNER